RARELLRGNPTARRRQRPHPTAGLEALAARRAGARAGARAGNRRRRALHRVRARFARVAAPDRRAPRRRSDQLSRRRAVRAPTPGPPAVAALAGSPAHLSIAAPVPAQPPGTAVTVSGRLSDLRSGAPLAGAPLEVQQITGTDTEITI